jgi:hypothetical protein
MSDESDGNNEENDEGEKTAGGMRIPLDVRSCGISFLLTTDY